MTHFAVRKVWRGETILGPRETREFVAHMFVEAPDEQMALERAISTSSVLSLKHGVTFTIVPVYWSDGESSHAQYDREPMTDGHASTGAKIVVETVL